MFKTTANDTLNTTDVVYTVAILIFLEVQHLMIMQKGGTADFGDRRLHQMA
jgi:hypothetical protein